MKTRLISAAAILLLGIGAASAFAPQEPMGPKPGKEHELLKQFEGNWDATSRFMMAPGQEPMVSKCKETARIIAGGLFLVFDVEGEMMGQKFAGHGTMGYDIQKKKYTGTWIDSMATGVYLVEGTADESGKVFTETMEGTDPASGKPMKMKMIHEVKDKDNRVLRFLMAGPDGKDIEGGSITYTRKK